MPARHPRAPLLAAFVALLASCSSPGGREARVPHVLVGSDSLDLAHATYLQVMEADGPVTLSGGRWEGVAAEPGAASRPQAWLLEPLSRQADLDGDGVPEAVALLSATGGGSGTSLYLAVVARREGRWRNVSTVWVGDRVSVREVRADSGRVTLDVVQAGDGDAMCCPGDLATRRWELREESLTEQPAVVTGRLSLAILEGSEWVLREWSPGERVPAGPEVTLACARDRWMGSSGCNRYTAAVAPGERPGDVRMGPTAGTRRLCPGPADAVETRYLRALGGVNRFGFDAGRLVLAYETEGGAGSLVFDRQEAPR